MQLISAADLLDSISFIVIRPTTRRWPSFNISVSIEPPSRSKGRNVTRYIYCGYFLVLSIALITATIIAVSVALTIAWPQIMLPALTSFLL